MTDFVRGGTTGARDDDPLVHTLAQRPVDDGPVRGSGARPRARSEDNTAGQSAVAVSIKS